MIPVESIKELILNAYMVGAQEMQSELLDMESLNYKNGTT